MDENIGAYLVGLVEGDGYIEIRSENSKIKQPNPRFVFTRGSGHPSEHPDFHKNNLALFENLKVSIGAGFLKKGPGNTIRYVVADLQSVTKLTHQINGYFRTPKIQTWGAPRVPRAPFIN